MKISVTDIDSWAWYLKLENMDDQELIRRLKRMEPPNEKMLIGTAFHKILESPPDEINTIEQNGYTFIVECDSSIELPPVREIKHTKTYRVNGINVDVTGKVDGINGLIVADHKLTFRPNLESYFDSYQWKAYLDMFNADKFVYYIYTAKQQGDNTIVINDISELTMYRYPEMQKDLLGGMSGLVNFIQNNM